MSSDTTYLIIFVIIMFMAACAADNSNASKPNEEQPIQKLSEQAKESCSFSMKQIKPGDGGYIAVAGLRYCPDIKSTTQEVVLYSKGESINNKSANVFVTTDTLYPVSVEWRNDTLVVSQIDRTVAPVMEETLVEGIVISYLVLSKVAMLR